jgi:hypothetical protein
MADNQENNYGLPSNYIPIESAPVIPGVPPANAQIGPGQYFAGPLASNLQHDAAFYQTKYGGSAVPEFPLIPVTASGNASSNASVTSIIKTTEVIGGSGAAEFETNSIPNSTNSLLNLIAGTNITLSEALGNVTITSSPGIQLETNSVLNSSQTILNLTAGSNVTLTAGAGGLVTIASVTPALETNGVLNSSQSVLNLTAGSNVTLTAGSGGLVTITSSPGILLETNSVANSSQTTLNLIAGSNITLTDGGGGAITITGSPSSSTQAIQAITTNSTIGTVIGNTATTISIISIAFPSSGGPFRVMISYSLYLNFAGITNVPEIDFWVSDGTNTMAGVETGQSNASSGGRTSASYGGISTVSYANSAIKTFTLFGIQPGSAGAVVENSATNGSGPGSTFQITVFTSAV